MARSYRPRAAAPAGAGRPDRHLRRLGHVRELLGARGGLRAEQARLLLFSGRGFSEELRAAAQDPGTRLIDPARLYYGS